MTFFIKRGILAFHYSAKFKNDLLRNANVFFLSRLYIFFMVICSVKYKWCQLSIKVELWMTHNIQAYYSPLIIFYYFLDWSTIRNYETVSTVCSIKPYQNLVYKCTGSRYCFMTCEIVKKESRQPLKTQNIVIKLSSCVRSNICSILFLFVGTPSKVWALSNLPDFAVGWKTSFAF